MRKLSLNSRFAFLISGLTLSACNPLGGSDGSFSTTSGTFTPGLASATPAAPVPFTKEWDFSLSNASSFTLGTNLDLTANSCELTSASQTDNAANSQAAGSGFQGGNSTGTAYSTASDVNGQSHYVMLSQSGSATDLELDSSWTPAWSNLVGYWKLNDIAGSGTAADSSSVATHVGTVFPGVTLGGPGKLNTAASFNGAANAYVSIPDSSSLNITSNLTLSAWIKTSVVSSPVIYASNAGTAGTNGFAMCLGYPTVGKIGYYAGNNGTWVNGNTAVNDGLWHQVAVSVIGTTVYFYVDGVLDGTQPTSIATSYSGPRYIGYSEYTSSYFNGLIDDVAVWNTGLSASALATIYQHESAKYAGTFTSRVMDGLSNAANWTNFSWIPTLPFFKELPDSTSPASPVSETQANYSSLIDANTTPGTTKNLMDGIVGLWHLDEASGAMTVIDSSGNGNNGTPVGGTTLGKNGQLGNAALFDGSTSYLSIPTSPSLAVTGDITISAWINPTSFANNEILGKTLTSYPAPYDFWLSNTGIPYLLRGDGGQFTWSDVPATHPVTLGVWNHVVVTMSGTSVVHYLNAQTNGTGILNATIGDAGQFLGIGSRTNLDIFFNGKIDEVAIWKRALSASEVLELYRRGANRIKYQVRTCSQANCSDDATNSNWKGPDNTNQSYFSELNNNAVQSDGGDLTGSDSVQASLPTMTFSNFPAIAASPTSANRYFQYRAIMESDDTSTNCSYDGGVTHTWCSPELKSVSVGPGHYQPTSTVTTHSGTNFQTLSGFTETLGINGCASGTLYTISLDNSTWYYWTGAAWGIADGTTNKANPASALNANIASFASEVGKGNIFVRAILRSSGTSACELSSIMVSGSR